MSPDGSLVESDTASHALDPHQHPDTVDLFADVSHHGASLFELFAVPSALDSIHPSRLPRPSDAHIQNHPHDALPHSTTDITVDFSSLSAHHHQVDSYCTADPDFSALPAHSGPQQPLSLTATTTTTTLLPPAPPPPPPPPSAPAQSPPPSQQQQQHVQNVPRVKPPLRTSDAPKLRRKQSKSKKPTRSPTTKTPTLSTPSSSHRTSTKLLPSKTIAKNPSVPSSTNKPTSSTARRKRSASQDIQDADFESDASDAVTDSSKLPTPPPPVTPSQDNGSFGDSLNKDTHNSHTRRCRAKVNFKFQELLSILPAPPSKTGIKHKAQILDYAIRVYRDVHARKTLLEAELALSSRSQLNAWIELIVSRSGTLQDALAPYLSLICTKGGWKYSEAWVPTQDAVKTSTAEGVQGMSGDSEMNAPTALAVGPNTKLRLGLAVIPSLGNTDDPDLQTKLERFRDRSRPYAFKARDDLPGRIMCTMRPEWLPVLSDREAFHRAKLAKDASLVVCFGVPMFIRGHVAAVGVFFDTEQRAYDAKSVDLADSVATLLGNSFGASVAKREK